MDHKSRDVKDIYEISKNVTFAYTDDPSNVLKSRCEECVHINSDHLESFAGYIHWYIYIL